MVQEMQSVENLLWLGEQCRQMGRLSDAAAAYAGVLAQDAGHPRALLGAGKVALALGDHALAADRLAAALPGVTGHEQGQAWEGLGEIAARTGNGTHARLCYRNAAICHLNIGDLPEAIRQLERLLIAEPTDDGARMLLVRLLRQQAAANPAQARSMQARAEELDRERLFLRTAPLPALPVWWHAINDDFTRQQAAIAVADAVADANADFDPDRIVALFQVADGWFPPGIAENMLETACWFCVHSAEPDFRLHRRLIERWWQTVGVPIARSVVPCEWPDRPDDAEAATRSPLRIGILDLGGTVRRSEYYNLLLAPSIRQLGGDRFVLTLYVMSDAVAEDARKDFAVIRILDGGPGDVAILRQDDLDVLLVIDGFQTNAPISLFAARPARRLALWIHTHTTYGPELFDALLPDPGTFTPFHREVSFEPIILMAGRAYLYGCPTSAPPVVPGPRHRNGYITFGMFNRINKVTRSALLAWKAILEQVPDGRMVIANSMLSIERRREALLAAMADVAFPMERVHFAAVQPSHDKHLELYGDVDIALDTFPYNGGATMIEALWQGVPLVSLADDSPLGRTSAAFLPDAGLGGLATWSVDDYIRLAVELARDGARLDAWRAGLRQQLASSPMMAGDGYADRFENAMRRVLALPRRGLPSNHPSGGA